MKPNIVASATIALGLLTGEASALTATYGDASPTIIDALHDPFYIIETSIAGGGAYQIFNNTSNLTLIGFGVSNPDPFAIATIDGDQTGQVTFTNFDNAYGSGGAHDYWEAINLHPDNWGETIGVGLEGGLYQSYYGDRVSAQALFGSIVVALGGEGYANYFQVEDGDGLLPGQNGVDFGFANASPASYLFGVAVDENNENFAFIASTAPAVPLPAGGVLLLSAIGGFGGLSLFRRRASAA